MTRALLQQALDALTKRYVRLHESAAEALRAELAKPEQESKRECNPVDCMYIDGLGAKDCSWCRQQPPAQPAQEPKKLPGMAVQALAGEIIAALLADENDGGFDLTAGLFGAEFSKLVRRWAAAEWEVMQAQPAQEPLTEAEIEKMLSENFGYADMTTFARAIEAAHGIGSKA